VRDRATLDRIRALAIPPAWTEVWICSLAHGHLQATGRDVRGRKQYRYHEEWNSVRGTTKYERVIAFGRVLPRIRRRVQRDLRREGLGREKVLAVVVQLLEATLIRVGNEEYARENGSFGLTTLRDRHVTFNRGTVRFQFLGKSGKTHDVQLHDARLSRLVKRLQELPGQDLFQYIDETGERQKVTSEDINAYLREVAGEEFSAKDFRTWSGTLLAAQEFAALVAKKIRPTKRLLKEAIIRVAERLGNTPTICRKCYIHPHVMDGFLVGETIEVVVAGNGGTPHGAVEAAVLAFLKRRMKRRPVSIATALRRSITKAAA
ncbi:MAG: topoisomerase, partial [Verrucomicrobia bacterium]|nr:topoisomerase [Verrucomicrobiota bacterium]